MGLNYRRVKIKIYKLRMIVNMDFCFKVYVLARRLRMLICTHISIAALLIIAEIWKQSKYSTNELIMKLWYIYIMEYYPIVRKEEIL